MPRKPIGEKSHDRRRAPGPLPRRTHSRCAGDPHLVARLDHRSRARRWQGRRRPAQRVASTTMPVGSKRCQPTNKTACWPRPSRRSATSTSLNSRPSFRPAASAEIEPRTSAPARAPALQGTAPDRRTSPENGPAPPRSPRLRNPDQLRRGERYRPRHKGGFGRRFSGSLAAPISW